MNGLRFEWIDPKTLTPNPKNWRRHPASQREILAAILEEVGWAGALLWNEQTERLIDGHERRDLAIALGLEAVPVLIGRWSEAQEAKTLATLDQSGTYATADAAALDALLREVDSGSAAVMDMLSRLAEDAGAIPADWGGAFEGLPTGDKAPFQQMTFTLHDSQAERVKEAIARARGEVGEAEVNENSNGNALAHICGVYLDG